MAKNNDGLRHAEILAVVTNLLEVRGYDGWRLSDVAEQARASLRTIYAQFPSRNALIVAALEQWMEEHAYRPLQGFADDRSLHDTLTRVFRAFFGPWEQHPRMLEVWIRASNTAGGDQLRTHAFVALQPLKEFYEGRVDPGYLEDLDMILTAVVEGTQTMFLNGAIAVTDILPTLERTLYRLEQGAALTSRPTATKSTSRARRRAG